MSKVFELRVMDVPGSRDRFFIEFIETPDEVDARFSTGGRLTVNFTSF